jgi:hypothetical protein
MTNGQGNGWTPPQQGGAWGNPAQPPQQPQAQPQQPQQPQYQQPPQQPPGYAQPQQPPPGYAQPQPPPGYAQPPQQGMPMPGQMPMGNPAQPDFNTNPFAGLNSGESTNRHPYLNAGFAYKLRIHAIRLKPQRQGGKLLYIIEHDILDTNDPALPAGTRASSMIDMSNINMRGINMAKFVAAVHGVDPGTLPQNSEQAPWQDAVTGTQRTWTEYATESVHDTNPWTGREVGCVTAPSMTQANKPFTVHNWCPIEGMDIPVAAASFPQAPPPQPQQAPQGYQQPQQPQQAPQGYQQPQQPPAPTPQQQGHPTPQQPPQLAPGQPQPQPQPQQPQQPQQGGPPNQGGSWGQQ